MHLDRLTILILAVATLLASLTGIKVARRFRDFDDRLNRIEARLANPSTNPIR